jgi:hypothetical protein
MGHYTGAGAKISTLGIDADLDMGAHDLIATSLQTVLGAQNFVKAASNNLRNSEDAVAEVNQTTPEYEIKKTITITNTFNGVLRTKFDVQTECGAGGVTVTARVYLNGIAIGSVQTATDTGAGSFVTKSEDIDYGSVAKGGVLTVRAHTNLVNYGEIKNFRLYYDNTADSVALGHT